MLSREGQVDESTDISDLMTIFTDDNAYDYHRFPNVSKRKYYFKVDERGVKEMCDIVRELVEEESREKEGIKELLIAIRLYNSDITIEEFYDYVKNTETYKYVAKDIVEEIFNE